MLLKHMQGPHVIGASTDSHWCTYGMPQSHSRRVDGPSQGPDTRGVTEEGAAVGRAIRQLREAANVTQSQLGEALDTDQSGVSKIERGRPQATLTQIRRVEQALGLSPGTVLRVAGLVEEDSRISPLLGKVERLSERDRRIIDGIVDDMLGGS